MELPTRNELLARLAFGTPEERVLIRLLIDAGQYRPVDEDDPADHSLMRLIQEQHRISPERYQQVMSEDADLQWEDSQPEPRAPQPENPAFFQEANVSLTISPPEPTTNDNVMSNPTPVDAEIVDVNPHLKAWAQNETQEELAEKRRLEKLMREEIVYTGDSQDKVRRPSIRRIVAGQPSPPPTPGYSSDGSRQPLEW